MRSSRLTPSQFGFGLVEHVGDRIEAVLQRQRLDGVADVLVGQVEAEAIGQQPAQADDAVVGDLAENRLDDVPRCVVLVAEQHLVVERVVAAIDADRGDRQPGVVH